MGVTGYIGYGGAMHAAYERDLQNGRAQHRGAMNDWVSRREGMGDKSIDATQCTGCGAWGIGECDYCGRAG